MIEYLDVVLSPDGDPRSYDQDGNEVLSVAEISIRPGQRAYARLYFTDEDGNKQWNRDTGDPLCLYVRVRSIRGEWSHNEAVALHSISRQELERENLK